MLLLNTTAHASNELADSNDHVCRQRSGFPVTHQDAVALNSKQSTVTETPQASDQSGASINGAHQVATNGGSFSAGDALANRQPATVDLTLSMTTIMVQLSTARTCQVKITATITPPTVLLVRKSAPPRTITVPGVLTDVAGR